MADQPLLCDEYKFDGKAILLAGNGNFSVSLYNGKFNAYQRTYVLIPKNESHFALVYFAVKDSVNALTKGSRGSIIKFITKGDIKNIYIPMPSDSSQHIFWETLNTSIMTILKNQNQNLELTQIRDWLLPMLMNGQVKVS